MVMVLAFNCSPRMENGNTALILNPFIAGMRKTGANVELLYTKKLKIEPCIGDFQCWSKTPGKCHYHDDMPELLARMSEADYWVFGAPVYAKLPGELQNLFNRTMPLFEPKVVRREGSLLPSRKKEMKLKRIALVSSCSYWGIENFDLVVKTFEFMAKAFDARLSRPLLRPNADLLSDMIKKGENCENILKAAEKAGTQFAGTGIIGKDTSEAVQAPLMSLEQFLAENG
ncbi:MAG: flavodoxin family protein [Thermoplasmata archaeon]|nr:flavodoxin family protein [Thermoplasmata archaeon]